MNTSQLLAHIAAALRMPALQLDETDTCGIVMDGVQVDLHFVDPAQALCLCGEVGAIDPRQRPQAMRQLMQNNLSRSGIGKAHFALDDSDDTIFLCQTLGMQHRTAESVIDHLKAMAAACRVSLESLQRQGLVGG